MTATEIGEKTWWEQKGDRFVPLYDYLACTQVRRSNRVGLLYVPDEAREDWQRGKVLASGMGIVLEDGSRAKLTVQVGDDILWAKYFENQIDLGREHQYAAVREKDVIGIIRKHHGKDAIEPLYNTVVIEADPLPAQDRGLWLPQQVKRPLMPPMTGTVVDHGPGYLSEKDGGLTPLAVKKGDRVLFEAYGGEDHEFGGKTLRLIPEQHVLTILLPD